MILCQIHIQHASHFAPISARFRANFMFSTHHDFVRNWEPIFGLAPNHVFVLAQTCPNSNVTKVIDHNRSYAKCHLQPYKRFLQMTCNCGTPLIHISHVQNIVDIFFFIHFHLFYCKNPENKNHVCIN